MLLVYYCLIECIRLEIRNILDTSYVVDNASKRSKKPGKSKVNQSSKYHSKDNLFTDTILLKYINVYKSR